MLKFLGCDLNLLCDIYFFVNKKKKENVFNNMLY